MNYSKLVPSRELCEEMARLGICQDKPELYWRVASSDVLEWYISESIFSIGNRVSIVAPTLPRMMEELPCGYTVGLEEMDKGYFCWCVFRPLWNDEIVSFDKNITNSIAKALIALKKG